MEKLWNFFSGDLYEPWKQVLKVDDENGKKNNPPYFKIPSDHDVVGL